MSKIVYPISFKKIGIIIGTATLNYLNFSSFFLKNWPHSSRIRFYF